ncbi:sulfite exporter TauE/SafE family protein [Zwartia vadi]|uniref:sulfite exporter TauE/SafE family protein n=1 Tax=Zwartia vadi TaxID=3058168 RepID=UPI0025B46A25|nr:sulfite exporter TauE/SafE family protein [Zwartia vadi]MDN3986311.1 sulfite exporter TauE/SafE family protein [Zwartia vadi]
MSLTQYVAFISIALIAAFCQNLTGFAFGLILVGLTGALQIISIADAANIACILSIANNVVYLSKSPRLTTGPLLKPMLITSMIGLVLGFISLSWFTDNGINTLRLILGVCIFASAIALFMINTNKRKTSGKYSTMTAGFLTGILGGMFATPGPPLVYHLYSQPLDKDLVRHYLFIVFSLTSAARLVIALLTGELTMNAVILSAIAFPAITIATILQIKHPINLSRRVAQLLVTALLLATGLGLMYSSFKTILD